MPRTTRRASGRARAMSETAPYFHELRASGNLPSPTGVALTLLELTQREDVTIAEIARVLRGDPALTGRLLKFTNSPLLGYRRAVASVPEAILLVGLRVVRQLVLGLSVLSTHREGHCRAFDYDRFWSQCLAMAVGAELLCARQRGFAPEEAFTCALLAQVGQLALATVYPEQYADLLEGCPGASEQERQRLERETFFVDSAQLTVAMLEDWGLPATFRAAVAALAAEDPEPPAGERAGALHQTLRLARCSADLLTCTDAERGARMQRFIDAFSPAILGESELGPWLEELSGQWREWSRILEVPAMEIPELDALLQGAAAEREAGEPAAAGAASLPSPLRVLVAEDDALSRRLLVEQIEGEGHEVLLARSGREALALALQWAPQVVITDWMLPELDGLGLCRALRSTHLGERMHIIVVTGKVEDPHVTEAVAAGADDYLVKPVNPRVLAAHVLAGARRMRLQQQMEAESARTRQTLAELAIANRRLEQTVLTDPLTELPNRRYADRRLQQVWAGARRNGESLACMLVDVDEFKAINDLFGHDAGDRVLREVALVLRSAARTDDEVCRIGGEEFLIICSSSDAAAAEATAERLRRTVERTEFELEPPGGRITISVGVAARDAIGTDPDCLMKLADQAVYAAKHAGRNRVCVWTGADPAAGLHDSA